VSGWPTIPLGELCNIALGATPPRGSPRFWDTEKATSNVWLSIADLPSTVNAVVSDSKEYLSDEGAARGKIVKKGTLLVSFKLTLGRLAFAGCDLRTNEAIAALTIRNHALIENAYLYWFLTHFDWDKAAEGDEKVKGKTLNKEKLKVLPVIVPPLEEQRRIVAVLDEAFAAIAQATANAEKNLANARELFERQLDFQMEQATREGSLRRLADICDVRDGTHYSPKYVEFGIPFVTQKNIRDDGLSLENTKNISEEDHQNFCKRSNVAFGDIIISMIGANRGMACIVDDSRTFSIKNVGLVKSNERVSMPFLLYFLKSSIAKRYVKAESNGGAQEFIGLTKLRDFPVINLPLDRQQQIATSLDMNKVQSDRLTSSYSKKIANLNALKQSLLHRAFTGELATTPELTPA
jgi:type I restriction enzyme S subunit